MRSGEKKPKIYEMKVLFGSAPILLGALFFVCPTLPVYGAGEAKVAPLVGGPWTELRKAPLFDAERLPLAKTWGPTLPVGSSFQVEKVYGRWLYGTPLPLPYMKAPDYARPGWVFSRMLLLPGDQDSLSPAQLALARAVIFHSRDAWKKLQLGSPLGLDVLEGMVLSRGTLNAFKRQDENVAADFPLPKLPPLVPELIGSAIHSAQAADEPAKEGEAVSNDPKFPAAAAMGLSGTDLQFLDQEFAVVQKEKARQEKIRLSKILRPPPPPKLDQAARISILGRFMLQKYFELPVLTHEEIDGHIYMRATALRALEGCAKNIQDHWKNRHWNTFRVFRLKSRPDPKHPWLDLSLPGGYFTYSARAIDLANNEAELAFLLVRPLVKESRLKRPAPQIGAKGWPSSLQVQSELIWDRTLRAQSTRDSENLDVADDIAIDLQALECIAKAGYSPVAGLGYLRKLAAAREEPWSKWFVDHSIGLEYRLEQDSKQLEDSLAKQRFPAGRVTNTKRFSLATTRWNLMP